MAPLPIVLTNRRRKYFPGLMISMRQMTDLGPGLILDDSGDYEFLEEIRDEYPGWEVRAVDYSGPAGYNAAMQRVWAEAENHDHVVFLEEDFRFERKVRFTTLANVLDLDPDLVQVALLRQPWFSNEIQAGGLIPALVQQGHMFIRTAIGLTHRAYFTTNPCIFRGRDWVKNHPWPTGDGSEYAFTRMIFDHDRAAHAMYLGQGEIWVTHVGEREGFGY